MTIEQALDGKEGMGSKRRIIALFCISNFFLLFFFPPPVCCLNAPPLLPAKRETLEIIIGGGGGGGRSGEISSPSPSPEYQQPCPPLSVPPSPPPTPPPLPPPPPPSPPVRRHPPRRSPPRPKPASNFENDRLRNAYFVIQEFRSKITSDPFHITDTWNSYNVCDYSGFGCDRLPNTHERTISGADFNGRLLCGPQLSLDGLLNRLPDITFFHANSNNFTGGIPKNISQLQFFYEYDLSNNNYTDEFPMEILSARQLLFLDLRFNNYRGPVPAQLFYLDLQVIFINNNGFTGELPKNFGSTPANYLTFANNQFTGSIPRSIGQANKTLVEVLFLGNKFTGCLPYEMGFLEKATVIDVSKNYLTGPIPLSFACLSKMELLNLADNKFYGTVPEIVCKLPNIGNLTLRNNFFTQIGPACRILLAKKILDVSMNCILGLPDQKSKVECSAFFSKPYFCPDVKFPPSIPCKNMWYLHSNVASPANNDAASSSPRKTYDALSPHNF